MVQPINYLGNVPDPTAQLLEGLAIGSAIREMRQSRQASAAAEKTQQQYAVDLEDALSNPSAQKFAALTAKYPGQENAFKQSWSMLDKAQQDQEFLIGSQAFNAISSGKVDIAKSLIDQQIEAARNSGRPVANLEAMRNTLDSNPKIVQAQLGLILSNVNPDKWQKIADENREATLFPLLQRQKQVELSKATSEAQKSAIEAKYADELQQAQLAKAKRDVEAQSGQRVQSSSIRPDGTVVIVTSAGQTRVIGPDGVELTGQARVEAVRGAEEFGADIQALRSGARKAGEIGQTEAQKAFENVGKIRKNISNLDSAIAALDAGANTGVIASKFPNWKASTIELQNIQRQLGLDIIGSVTFGALSEGELSLALETALPLNMNEAELKDWLTRKKNAQVKLSDYITEQARFLSVPGRTLGDWLQRSEQRGGTPGGMTPPGTGGAPPVGAGPAPTPAAAAPAPAAGAGGVRVTSPSGQVFTFPNQQAADAFKQAAGIR